KTLVASAGVTVMATFPKDRRWLTDPRRRVVDPWLKNGEGFASGGTVGQPPAGARGDDCRHRPWTAPGGEGIFRADRRRGRRCGRGHSARLWRLVSFCRGGFEQRPRRGSRVARGALAN